MDAEDQVETELTDHNQAESPQDSGYNSRESEGSSVSSSGEDYQASLIDELHERCNITDEEELDSMLDNELLDEDVELIFDNNIDDKTSMTFEKTATVSEIISRSIGSDLNPENYDLKINGRILPRNITLRDAGVLNGTKVRLIEREFQIFIRRVDGRTTTMQARSSDTIQSLKEQFFHTDQVPMHQQRLLFQSKELENTRTLNEYKIRSQSCLDMVYRLRGGRMSAQSCFLNF